ncbi:MAG: DUF285 domain-containing protein [Acidipropionibacterium jensenii]|uniref:BspA family leucine-rich repeat surface protein n=1 Tax=Acidipropionibacterium jensenii TaxID=1749 RepID=UPI002648E9FD|nr:BspA family leucine-rich repeat surface protein [Acidipropionibacterium jensenii]MDN6440477.1 DUF285 domain-containing protein [Acidipropionibacterium jensenii]MDN6658937.1 DUF285 domain-containing protein [Acidipropionibacterium jensenii]
MALNVGSLPVAGVYAGSTEVQKVYVGAVLVWENRETVTITGTSGTQARDSFRAALSARGLDYGTVTEIPFLLDTSNVTNMDSMFYNCKALTSVPDMNTSNVTDMYRMFYGCSSLTSVQDMDTSNVTVMYRMFQNCKALTDGNVRCIGKKIGVNTSNMIHSSGLTRLPFYDTNGNWTG